MLQSRKQTHIRKARTWLIAIAGLTVVLVGAAMYMISSYANKETLPDGFTVSGWEVGGLTYQEFETQLADRLTTLEEQQVKVKSPVAELREAEFTLKELGFSAEADEAVQTVRSLREGSMWNRARARWSLDHLEHEINVHIDGGLLEKNTREQWADIEDSKPVNATRVINEKDQVEYTPERRAFRVDHEKLQQQIRSFANQWNWKTATPLPAEELTLPVEILEPEKTLKSLKDEGISRKIVEFTTSFAGSSEGRIHNIASTAKSIYDVVLKPDEVFSYADAVKRTREKFGYKEANVILNGKLVPGVGGGICQVSTTLYGAVLRSGIEITERRNHSLPIGYVPLGQDATYSTGYIDFKFKNTTGKHLLIRTITSGNQVTVKFFGTLPDGVVYEVESQVVDTVQPKIKYVKNPTLEAGKYEVVQKGAQGYIVETFRLKKQNGKVLEKVRVSRDKYMAKPHIIAVNNPDAMPKDPQKPSGDNPSGSETENELLTPEGIMIEDGISGPSFE